MLGKLIRTRAGRRIVVTLVVAILVISAIALYMNRQTGRTLPSTAPPGSATISGYPQTVNLTASQVQHFMLTFTVLERYVSGVTLSIDTASDVTNASAYFVASGSNWNAADNGNVVKSTAVSMQAGFSDANITLVVTGLGNVSGWIGVYQSALLGQVSPSFVKVNVTSYYAGTTNKVPNGKSYVRLDNLPATITVPSGAKGTFQVNYTAHNIPGSVSWTTNMTWIDVSTASSSVAHADYVAPVVTTNTTYVASISVYYNSTVGNQSTLQINVVNSSGGVPPHGHPGYIELDNLPATISVPVNSTTAFAIEYTTVNVTQPLSWNANISWMQISTANSTVAQADISPPATLDYNSTAGDYGTFVINVSVRSADNVTNHSTLTVTVTGSPPGNHTVPGNGNYFAYTYQNISVNSTFRNRGCLMYANVTAELIDAFLVNGTTMTKSFYNATIVFRVAVGNVSSANDRHGHDDGQCAKESEHEHEHEHGDDGNGPGAITVKIKLWLNVSTSGNTVTNVSMVKMSVHVDHGKHKGQFEHGTAVKLVDMPEFPLTVLFYSTGPPVDMLTQIEGAPT